MKKTVKIYDVEKTKAGKTDRLVLHYQILDGPKAGEVWKIGALAVKLDETSRGLLKIENIGLTVDIEIVKDGNYWNLESVRTAGSTPTASTSKAAGGTDNRQESIVFQNSMAHATAIAIHNAGKGKVKVDDILEMAAIIAEVSINPAAYKDKKCAELDTTATQQSQDLDQEFDF